MKRGGRSQLFWLAVLAMFASARPVLVRPRGARVTLTKLRALAAAAGFPDPDLAAAVAMAESSGNPNAMNVTARERSVGLWQINLMAHPQFDERALLDPVSNAQAAFVVSRGGADWSPWTMFKNGRYRDFMPGGPNA